MTYGVHPHLNTEPEHCEDGTADDGEVPQVITEATRSYHGERNMQPRPDGAVEHDGYGHGEVPEEHDGDGLPPRESHSEDRGRSLPCR